jgi:hypothetical protein
MEMPAGRERATGETASRAAHRTQTCWFAYRKCCCGLVPVFSAVVRDKVV